MQFPNENLGLYRDDGIGVSSKHGHEASTLEKQLHALFKRFGLKISTQVNVKRTDFLDVILDLNTGKISPYRKPSDQPMYVNRLSSHPPAVIKAIPSSINNRLSKLSSSVQEFDIAKPTYQDALKNAGYEHKLVYVQPEVPRSRSGRNRNRNCLWFNPPFSHSIQGNVTKLHSSIITRCFPKDHAYLHKLFNKHNLKLAYCTTPNLQSILSRHNQKILNEYNSKLRPPPPSCNCRVKNNCPLENKCLTTNVVYRADVTVSAPAQESKFYIGLTGNSMKQRVASHKTSFSHEKYREQTRLSMFIWDLKDKGADFSIKWSIVRRVRAYQPGDRTCQLCLAEKAEILRRSSDPGCLNKRSELFSKCRHRNSHLLMAVK